MNPKQFLTVGGAILLLLAIVGYLGVFSTEGSFFWLDSGENVAHLFAIAINCHRQAEERTHREPRHPPLVFNPELVSAVDARLTEHDRAQSVDPRIVANVLIGRALGTAIR